MSNLRILHIVGSLSKTNGTMSAIMNVYRKIDRATLQFDFLVSVKMDMYYANEISELGGRIYSLPPPAPISAIRYINEIKGFFDKHSEYNIIHCHLLPVAPFFLYVAEAQGIESRIMHSHVTNYGNRVFSRVRNRILRLPTRFLANQYLACSQSAGVFLFGERAVADGRVHIVRNVIDAEKFRYDTRVRDRVRSELGLTDEIVVGHVGAFLPIKNHSLLIDILEQLDHLADGRCKLLLAGDGPLRKPIQNRVGEKGLSERVIFLGVRDDIECLMQAMDVLVLPSLKEGFPLVGVESQAAALPTIFSDSVTREIGVTEYAFFMSLDQSTARWAEEILRVSGVARRDTTAEIVAAGLDAGCFAPEVERFYRNLVGQ